MNEQGAEPSSMAVQRQTRALTERTFGVTMNRIKGEYLSPTNEIFDRKTVRDLVDLQFIRTALKKTSLAERCDVPIGECAIACSGCTSDLTFAEAIEMFLPVTFAILLRIHYSRSIEEFFDAGVRDDSLPLTLEKLQEVMKNPNAGEWFVNAQMSFLVRSLPMGGHVDYEADEKIPFRLHEELGLGIWNRGCVYRATCVLEPTKVVAIKRSTKSWHRKKNGELDEAFMKEVEIMRSVPYRNLIKCVGTFTHQGSTFAVLTPYCETSLHCVLDQPKLYFGGDADEKRRIIFTWCSILARTVRWLHDRGIIHKNIKPQNILLKGTEIYLTDYGTVRTSKDPFGTGEYGSPEIFDDRKPPIRRSADVFSLGCVYLDLLNTLEGRSRDAYRGYRSVKICMVGIESQCAFRENTIKALFWFDRLKRGTAERKLWKIVMDMVHHRFEMRMDMDDVRDKVREIVLDEFKEKGWNIPSSRKLDTVESEEADTDDSEHEDDL